jgi:hypothetical protein
VEEKDTIIGVPGGVAVRLAEGEVVKLQLGDGFAGVEAEVLNDVSAVLSEPLGGSGLRVGGDGRKRDEKNKTDNVGAQAGY